MQALVCALLLACVLAPTRAQALEPSTLDERFNAGDWHALAAQNENPALRAWAQIELGAFERAEETLDRLRREESALATTLGARIGQLLGEREQALQRLDALIEANPQAAPWRALCLRARIFDEVGRGSRAAVEYRAIIDRAREDGAEGSDIATLTPHDRALCVGEALVGLRDWHAANAHYQANFQSEQPTAELAIAWARLFLDRYRPDEAMSVVQDALGHFPAHADLLALAALSERDLSYDIPEVRRYVEAALQAVPEHVTATRALALLHLDVGDWQEALRLLQTLDRSRPDDPETLRLLAAAQFVAGDEQAYRSTRQRVESLRSRDAALLTTVADAAVRVFRYPQALELYREAAALNAQHAPAWLGLSLSLSRSADDSMAQRMLEQAAAADPFSRNAYYMAELWEGPLREYVLAGDDEQSELSYRYHQREAAVLDALVPPVTRAALATYRERYGGWMPAGPLRVEFLRDPETFGIRTVGVPTVALHGVCFGELVAARSPNTGDFNWRVVLEHELSHVFSLQRSGYRVPRWFSEGMAELDTHLSDTTWRRELDLELLRKFQRGELMSVADLDEAFALARNSEEMVQAYFLSFLVVEYLHSRWGYEVLLAMLDGYATGQNSTENLVEVTSLSVDELDASFQLWLRQEWGAFAENWEPEIATILARWRSSEVESLSSDEQLFLRAADALESSGDSAAFGEVFARLSAETPIDHELRFVGAWLAARTEQWERAVVELELLMQEAPPSFSVASTLARVLSRVGREAHAREVWVRAAELNPYSYEAAAARAEQTGDDAVRAMRWASVSDVNENDAQAARAASVAALAAGDTETAAHYAWRALSIAPFSPEIVVEAARATALAGWREELRLALDVWASMPGLDRSELTALRERLSAMPPR